MLNHAHEWKHGLTEECHLEVPQVLIDRDDPSFLLTEETGQVDDHPGKGYIENRDKENTIGERGSVGGSLESMRETRQEHMHRGERVTRTCRRKEEGCELDVGEASDKPHRICERERIDENWHKFSSDIMAWHGGVQSDNNECL